MSILIKGMEMPCEEAEPLRIELYADGTVIVIKEQDDFYEFKAVPVPPHGRLGDLDVLAKQVEYERFHHAHTDGLAARHHVAEYGHFLKLIFDAPTIIPAEEGG